MRRAVSSDVSRRVRYLGIPDWRAGPKQVLLRDEMRLFRRTRFADLLFNGGGNTVVSRSTYIIAVQLRIFNRNYSPDSTIV